MGKKITQLATITEVADDDLIVGVDVSDTSGSDNGTNKKFTKATLLAGLAPLGPQLTGWNPDAETWVYHNVDDPTGYIKIEDKDVSANYSVGWRIMFTNGGNVIKGIITAITFTDPDTIITFLHEIDPTDNQALYLLTNSAITENYFSPHKAPLGFPMSPAKWSISTVSTSDINKSSPTQSAWYNTGLSVNVPIGSWVITVQGYFRGRIASGQGAEIEIAVSTSTNSLSNSNWTHGGEINGASGDLRVTINGLTDPIYVDLTSKTTHYLLFRTGYPSMSDLKCRGNITPTILRATCAYL